MSGVMFTLSRRWVTFCCRNGAGGHGNSALQPAAVFTALALLNMLIFPMNALPWVVTGCLEVQLVCPPPTSLLSHDVLYCVLCIVNTFRTVSWRN